MEDLQVVILNSPPNSGKDYVADYLVEHHGFTKLQFKDRLLKIAKDISGLDDGLFNTLFARKYKERKTPYFEGLSPREFLIKVSEECIKPNFGKDYFGVALGRDVIQKSTDSNRFVISDGGFNEEVEALTCSIPCENINIIRLQREGCSFEGDSRNYISVDSIKNYADIDNNGHIQSTVSSILKTIEEKQ